MDSVCQLVGPEARLAAAQFSWGRRGRKARVFRAGGGGILHVEALPHVQKPVRTELLLR